MKNQHIIYYLERCVSKKSMHYFINNIRNNYFLPISALAYFCLNAYGSVGYVIGMAIAIVINVLIAGNTENIFNKIKKLNKTIAIIACLSTFGTCVENAYSFYQYWGRDKIINSINCFAGTNISTALIKWVAILGALAATLFVFAFTYFILYGVYRFITNSQIIKSLTRGEVILYGIIIISAIILTIKAFSSSQAFYATTNNYDIIYTSDSPFLIRGKVYVSLTHGENDLRQPLFAVFAAPFLGTAYLLNRIIAAPETVSAIVINSVQIVMLVFSNLVIASTLKLKKQTRMLFVVLFSCTYTFLLFSIMMEQYIVAYFWLAIVVYEMCEKESTSFLAINGAGGSLLTSYAVLLTNTNKRESALEQVKELLRFGLDFLVLMLAFCRFDTIYNLGFVIKRYLGYTGKGVSLLERIIQYSHFVHNIFLAPFDTMVIYDPFPTWQLSRMSHINIFGLIVLLVVLVSIFVNRKKKISNIAGFWVLFSLFMLAIVGWGSSENGMILYSLYFGWAYFVLIFQLVIYIVENIKCTKILIFLLILIGAVLLYNNIVSITELISFTSKYYPL